MPEGVRRTPRKRAMIALAETCDLISLASGLRSGGFRWLDYAYRLEALFQAWEPEIRAFLPEPARFARLHREAADLLQRHPDPEQRPPLFGVPIAVDDTIRVSGFETRAGSLLDPALLQGAEASCVTMLRRAGVLILGKGATTEFGYLASGATGNPRDLTRPVDTANAGAAAAVAAGLTPFALGHRAPGSTATAACRCGIAGFKPSYQRIGTDGLVLLSPSLDQVEWMAGNVGSLEWTFHVLTAVREPREQPYCLKIGIPGREAWEAMDPTLVHHFETVCAVFSAQGCSIQTIPVLDEGEAKHASALLLELLAVEAAGQHARWYAVHGELYGAESAELIERGRRVPARTAERARKTRLILRRRLESAMERHRLDLWLTPGAASLGSSPSWADHRLQLPWLASGLPSLDVPAGYAEDVPAGIRLTGRWYGDEQLLRYGRKLETMLERQAI